MKGIWLLLAVVTVLASVATAAGFLGRLYWFLDLTSHFRPQYLGVLAVCAVAFLLGGRPAWAATAGVFAAVNLILIIPLYLGSSPVRGNGLSRLTAEAVTTNLTTNPDRRYRILFVNVWEENRDYEAVWRLVRDTKPDFIALAEVDLEWLHELRAIEGEYPWGQGRLYDNTARFALLSRIPYQNAYVEDFGFRVRPARVATYEIEGGAFTLVGAHPHAPTRAGRSQKRNRQMAYLAELVAAGNHPVLMVGDLNMSPWSVHFYDFLQAAGLRNCRLGFGLKPTWPSYNALLRIPIDHCLASPGIEIHDFRVGPDIGSDHYPIIVDFSLSAAAERDR